MEKNNSKIIGAIESILFVYGEPMNAKKIAKILNRKNKQKIKESEVKEILEKLSQKYSAEDEGLTLIISGDNVQLTTKPEFSSILEEFIKDEFKEQLTPASLETLALISYLGPLSRMQIDYYRGVNSSFILRNLLIRGLVERFSDSQKSLGYLYKPSMDLLKYLGISRIEELPEYEKFKLIVDNIQL